MGATEFQVTQFGKDAADAFQKAVDEARHDHGHEGYTGTIAEKSEFIEVELPARVSVEKALAWAGLASEHDIEVDNASMYDKWDQPKRAKAARKLAAAAERKIPKQHRELAWKLAEIMDDKWGPALCLRVTGKMVRPMRERYGVKGRRGDFFVFAGMASS